MTVFINLLIEIAPLYFAVLLGFIIGRCFTLDVKSISSVTLFAISPVVFLLSVAKLDFQPELLAGPLLFFAIAILMALLIRWISGFYLESKTSYLSAMCTSTNNWGYFGIPIALSLFSTNVAAFYILTGVSLQFFESSFGIYFMSRGKKSPLQSFINIFRYPVIYAILGGITLSALSINETEFTDKILDLFKGAYTVMGMMIIGLGLSTIKKFTFDLKFLSTMFAVKFLLWPLVAIGIVYLNNQIELVDPEYSVAFLLLSIMPMAANNIAYASQFDMEPQKATMGVLFTTLFAMVYLPVMIVILGIQ